MRALTGGQQGQNRNQSCEAHVPARIGGQVPLPLIEVDAGTLLYRPARISFADPAYVGRAALLRVDAADRSFGVCYLGTTQSAQDARSIYGLVTLSCKCGLQRAVTVRD